MLKKQSMETVTTPEGTPQKGNILIINTGSTGYDGGDGGEGLDKD